MIVEARLTRLSRMLLTPIWPAVVPWPPAAASPPKSPPMRIDRTRFRMSRRTWIPKIRQRFPLESRHARPSAAMGPIFSITTTTGATSHEHARYAHDDRGDEREREREELVGDRGDDEEDRPDADDREEHEDACEEEPPGRGKPRSERFSDADVLREVTPRGRIHERCALRGKQDDRDDHRDDNETDDAGERAADLLGARSRGLSRERGEGAREDGHREHDEYQDEQ